MQPAIELRDVSKAFVLRRNRVGELKVRVLGWIHPRHREQRELFWALRDVTLTVGEGEFVGIVGPNGSGKSTLLRVIAGIFPPSAGTVTVRGRVAPMIELGVGFHHELSGRENVYLSTSLFGLSTADTNAIYRDIVEFAGLETFMDVPVKNYSTGMYARLGFAVATHLEAEVVLIDEVLVVGDEPFQERCLRRIDEMRRRGRSVVMVSHSLETIQKMCDRACLLVGGRLVASGDPEAVVQQYRSVLAGGAPAPPA